MPAVLGTFVPPKLSAAPSSPTAGQMYYDTATNQLMVYNGTGWFACGPSAMVPLGELDLTVGSTFSNIPQTYDHLRLVVRSRSTFNNPVDNLRLRPNNDSTANYYHSAVYVQNNAVAGQTAAAATSGFIGSACAATAAGGHYSAHDMILADYCRAGMPRTVIGSSTAIAGAAVANIRSDFFGFTMGGTTAITSLVIFNENGSFTGSGCRAWLYGIYGS